MYALHGACAFQVKASFDVTCFVRLIFIITSRCGERVTMPWPSHRPLELLVRCVPGLERCVLDELRGLRITKASPVAPGAIRARASLRQLYAANAYLRCASRVLVPVASFSALTHRELERQINDVLPDLDKYLPIGVPLAIRVRTARNRDGLSHKANIRSHVQELMQRPAPTSSPINGSDGGDSGGGCSSGGDNSGGDCSGGDSSGGESGPRLDITVIGQRVSLFVDSSGRPLHERTWRSGHPAAAGKSPLKHSVAAGMLMAAGWNDTSSSGSAPRMLIDPFCGSGTIPIEAAQMMLGLPAHAARSFALHHWPSFEPSIWASIAGETAERTAIAQRRQASLPPLVIVGTDRDAGVIKVAKENAHRAMVGNAISFSQAVVSDLQPPGQLESRGSANKRGLCLTNPPWGRRLTQSGGDARNLYARLGTVLAERCPNYALGVLVNDPKLARQAGIKAGQLLKPRLRMLVGGQSTYFMMADDLAVAVADQDNPHAPVHAGSGEGGVSQGAVQPLQSKT